ncbi:MAG TPA: hypothetical protein VEZ41_06795 [Allosphingosinicella sp.]|nr:hypothetical protein [Allosphingosinicella sp.]
MIEITDPAEIEAAQDQLDQQLRRELPSQGVHRLGFRPGGKDLELHSSGRGRLFYASDFVTKNTTPRWWNAFGFYNGKTHGQQRIAIELNVPKPASRNVAAFFAKQIGSGDIYLMHDCKMGGGKAGVCRSGFLQHSGLSTVEVSSPRGLRKAVVVARLGDDTLASRIALFARAVTEYKEGVQ